MKTTCLFLLLVCTNIFSVNKMGINILLGKKINNNEKLIQANKDAIIIRALCDKHGIFFSINDLQIVEVSKIKFNKTRFIKVFGKFCIFRENCAQYLINRSQEKDNWFVWNINQFKNLLLNYFDETEVYLQAYIDGLKNHYK